MNLPRALFAILTTLLCASSLPAFADPGYRLVPLDDGSAGTSVFDLNQRGAVVGMRSVNGVTHAFTWRAGTFTDLHDTVDPNSSYTQAAGLNDRGAVVGVTLEGDSFRGFHLRGTQVSPVTASPGEMQVFPFDINNRGQILVSSLGGAQSGSFVVDGGQATLLEGLPDGTDSFNGVDINERGVVAGNQQTTAGIRAVLLQDGTAMNLGAAPGADSSFAYDLNDRNQVVGINNVAGRSRAVRWRDGAMALLPSLPGEAASSAQSINNWGAIVGGTTIVEPEFRPTATLWLGNHVVELDCLIRADDPLKPFVHLETAQSINDRGDIVAAGSDSRTPGVRTIYFMTLFDN